MSTEKCVSRLPGSGLDVINQQMQHSVSVLFSSFEAGIKYCIPKCHHRHVFGAVKGMAAHDSNQSLLIQPALRLISDLQQRDAQGPQGHILSLAVKASSGDSDTLTL